MERVEMFTLKTARDKAQISQKDAAAFLGINVDTLRNYEVGKSQPDALMIKKIEELYGVRYDQLIFLECDYGKTVTKGDGDAEGENIR